MLGLVFHCHCCGCDRFTLARRLANGIQVALDVVDIFANDRRPSLRDCTVAEEQLYHCCVSLTSMGICVVKDDGK